MVMTSLLTSDVIIAYSISCASCQLLMLPPVDKLTSSLLIPALLNNRNADVIVADSRFLPISNADIIVADHSFLQ
ncbi:hypothetical protein F511_47482 [Dorcoceras hygrometricum]|uniref:Uncharacterized protein n=1 Tax=Dorcoceras hygrometricum TaxID=472368 RepID=A0A2Z6ZQX4_9LAMI|nr:hypothetical protein F511_47482 [Dorcoceras hygrometricum]